MKVEGLMIDWTVAATVPESISSISSTTQQQTPDANGGKVAFTSESGVEETDEHRPSDMARLCNAVAYFKAPSPILCFAGENLTLAFGCRSGEVTSPWNGR